MKDNGKEKTKMNHTLAKKHLHGEIEAHSSDFHVPCKLNMIYGFKLFKDYHRTAATISTITILKDTSYFYDMSYVIYL